MGPSIFNRIILSVFQQASRLRLKLSPQLSHPVKINLCSGSTRIPGYFNVDISRSADLTLDLSRFNLPFASDSIEAVVCISAINYFTYPRAAELIKDIHRILRPGGIARFGTQDLERIARKYVDKDRDFFFQQLPDGRDRFEGRTLGDKFAAWFYGYHTSGGPCRYFYDYDSLSQLFRDARFSIIERMDYRKSRLDPIELIDNRPGQMFYLEAVK